MLVPAHIYSYTDARKPAVTYICERQSLLLAAWSTLRPAASLSVLCKPPT